MYTAFYGLREKPFSLSPDPRFLFFAKAHREALAHLRYGLSQSEGFMTITGEVGTGKTTICRTLLQKLGPETEVAFLFNPARTSTELLRSIAQEFGLEPAGRGRHSLNDQLNQFLLEKRAQDRSVLLIVDEAQNLDIGVLEEIRLLSNLETDTRKLIQILLLGQPELDKKLDSDELRQLRERIGVRWTLTPLSSSETTEYVAHRLNVASEAEREIFTPSALREIHRRSRGVPRRINLLCDRSLLAGFAAGEHRIGRKLVKRASQELSGLRSGRAGAREWRSIWKLSRAFMLFVVAAMLGLGAGSVGGIRSFIRDFDVPGSIYQGETVHSSISLNALGTSDETTGVEELVVDVMPTGLTSESGLGPVANGNDDLHSELVPPEAISLESSRFLDEPRPPGPVGLRSERVWNTLAPGSYFGRLLDHTDPDLGRLQAGNAILEAYERVSYLDSPISDDELLHWIEERGLAILRVEDADLDELRSLDYPALLEVDGEHGGPRLVALVRMDEELGSLSGVSDSGPLEIPAVEIESQWNGVAYVVWESFEPIQNLLVFGQNGRGVAWLQAALVDLGVYAGEPNGIFDRRTEDGVMLFQSAQQIDADGAVGPRTQMILYEHLGRYPVPRLSGEGGAG